MKNENLYRTSARPAMLTPYAIAERVRRIGEQSYRLRVALVIVGTALGLFLGKVISERLLR
jgi:hypothetical protein